MRNNDTVTVRLPRELKEAMLVIQERDGVPISEQFRRGIKLYVASKNREAVKLGRARV